MACCLLVVGGAAFVSRYCRRAPKETDPYEGIYARIERREGDAFAAVLYHKEKGLGFLDYMINRIVVWYARYVHKTNIEFSYGVSAFNLIQPKKKVMVNGTYSGTKVKVIQYGLVFYDSAPTQLFIEKLLQDREHDQHFESASQGDVAAFSGKRTKSKLSLKV